MEIIIECIADKIKGIPMKCIDCGESKAQYKCDDCNDILCEECDAILDGLCAHCDLMRRREEENDEKI